MDLILPSFSAHLHTQWWQPVRQHAGQAAGNDFRVPCLTSGHLDRRRWTDWWTCSTSWASTTLLKLQCSIKERLFCILAISPPPHEYKYTCVSGCSRGSRMWPTPHASIHGFESSLATTWSITGSGPRGTKLSALWGWGVWGGCRLDVGPPCSPEHEQIASHQEQQQLDPET